MQLADVETVYYYTVINISYYHSTAADLKNFKNIIHSVYCIHFEILHYFNMQTAAAEHFSELWQAAVLKIINFIIQFTANTAVDISDTVVNNTD